MAFLHRQRSIPALRDIGEKAEGKDTPHILHSTGIENVPQKRHRMRTTSNMGTSDLMRRVSSIFLPRKKPAPPDLKLVNSALNSIPSRRSYSSSRDSLESEDDIRLPSGLGSAVTIGSNQSMPPSPFCVPPIPDDSFPQPFEYQRTRAISSPNLLRSLSFKMRGKAKTRRESTAAHTTPSIPGSKPDQTVAFPSKKFCFHLPPEIFALVLSYLPRTNIAANATISRTYVAAVRTALYSCIEFHTLSPAKAEQLVALLVSRSDLTDLVTSFICCKWPLFFLADAHDQSGPVLDHRMALLTATFTLALERMSNLVALTLPAFDVSLLKRHSAFGLRHLTFLHHTMSEAETKALFSWLDGQTNITSLRFPHLRDIPSSKLKGDESQTSLPRSPFSLFLPIPKHSSPSPSSSPLPSPHFGSFIEPSSDLAVQLASSTLLPNLTTLHVPTSLALLLSSPISALPSANSLSSQTSQNDTESTTDSTLSLIPRRPITDIAVTLSTTLYDGLRPAALMSGLRGTVKHLALHFSESVDKRTVEKVVGATGAALGSSEDLAEQTTPKKTGSNEAKKTKKKWEGNGKVPFVMAMVPREPIVGREGALELEMERELELKKWKKKLWDGLISLEISFRLHHHGVDEALYKSLHASLPRYNSLSSLFLCTSSSKSSTGANSDVPTTPPHQKPLAKEQVLLDSWTKSCPTLDSITLFSGARWFKDQ